MMMMKAVVLVVAVVASSVHVVQGQTSDPCDGISKKECKKKEECTYNSFNYKCFLTAGKGSVVRDGSQNVAPGKYCGVGGGQRNEAGDISDTHNVIGGGDSNYCALGSKNTISGGKLNAIASVDVQEFDTISGGLKNFIFDSSYSVITGGGGEGDGFTDNKIGRADTSTISGGSQNLIERSLSGTSNSSGNTISGGDNNIVFSNGNGAITGGFKNWVEGQGAVVVGGESNHASGRNSLAFGQSAITTFDHSMVVNLIGGLDQDDKLEGTKAGEFLMNANSFRFQIGNGKGKGGLDLSTTITKQNIPYLRAALDEE